MSARFLLFLNSTALLVPLWMLFKACDTASISGACLGQTMTKFDSELVKSDNALQFSGTATG